ncbi:MAG: GspH/FimT family pseudopilin [Gammaproteobacteria bacterium]
MDDRRQSGYTLIELLLTIALVGIFSRLATPSFRTIIEQAQLRSSAETLVADMRQARMNAIQSGINQSMSFSTARWCYADNCTDFSTVSLSRFAFGGGNTIVFYAQRGFARNGKLNLTGSAGSQVSIIVSLLGRVRICSANSSVYTSC